MPHMLSTEEKKKPTSIYSTKNVWNEVQNQNHPSVN